MIGYRMLRPEELTEGLLADFQRRQEIRQRWRKTDGIWTIETVDLTEDWNPQDREFVRWCLGKILEEGGAAVGAFREGKLKGIAAVDAHPLGSRGQYRELSGLWVSQEMRSLGIGRILFAMAKEAAGAMGGEKLYISSNPAAETQAFYRAMGCTEAKEYSALHAQRNPLDCQIECSLP